MKWQRMRSVRGHPWRFPFKRIWVMDLWKDLGELPTVRINSMWLDWPVDYQSWLNTKQSICLQYGRTMTPNAPPENGCHAIIGTQTELSPCGSKGFSHPPCSTPPPLCKVPGRVGRPSRLPEAVTLGTAMDMGDCISHNDTPHVDGNIFCLNRKSPAACQSIRLCIFMPHIILKR